MVERFRDRPATSLTEVILWRFEDNAASAVAVRQLAREDLWRPIDTLGRTALTARAMLACRGATAGPLRAGVLTVAYCGCVLVWLGDLSPRKDLARRAVPRFLAMIGQR
jgi:hypothetical protein